MDTQLNLVGSIPPGGATAKKTPAAGSPPAGSVAGPAAGPTDGRGGAARSAQAPPPSVSAAQANTDSTAYSAVAGQSDASQAAITNLSVDELVEEVVQNLNDFVQLVQRDLRFSVDDSTGRAVVQVFDAKNDEMIRQFPPEELLTLASRLDEVRGMFLRETT